MEKNDYPVKRNYKDTLFRMVFKEKDKLLSLYNAISGKQYTDPDALEIVTLENAIFMNMKNDLAFVVDCSLHMYEHQSTYSPNMPLRNLFYVTRELEKMVSQHTLYSERQVKIPSPCFIVFYNGIDRDWARKTLKLSDAYLRTEHNPDLELKVSLININCGKNDDLLLKCKTLCEYTQYIEKVRGYCRNMDIRMAVQKAVNESIAEGVLSEFLIRYKAEAIQVSIFEYDEERELELIRQDQRYLGREEGREEGRAQGRKEAINLFIVDKIEDGIEDALISRKLKKLFDIGEEEAEKMIAQCRNNN